MSDAPVRVTYRVHTARRQQAIVLKAGPLATSPGLVPRVARLVALAHHFERLLAGGTVATQAELAALAGISPPRVTQILNLALLAPDIQEELLFWPGDDRGPDTITERTLRYVLRTPVWAEQRARWAEIRDG
ncbi:hypothetical protein [Haliangium ochraceum]|uniref:Uncharacterized protein n=1 Tax=Haliangium ochraceum (strain DSM 14365 / JCM 11303 / SMP-2) TaxID=502025 RepID=D0LPM6_HALO1|nr:hypothetical protein [Haliangium ochraceum]ACY15389.1 conserved hypothetical protein [Haliangium ochraceum DSM 14365]